MTGADAAETGFIAKHGLWTDEQREAGERLSASVAEKDLREVLIALGDQHGIVRGKTLTIPKFFLDLKQGKDFQFVTTIFDTTNHPIVLALRGRELLGCSGSSMGCRMGCSCRSCSTSSERAALGSSEPAGSLPTLIPRAGGSIFSRRGVYCVVSSPAFVIGVTT